ncbi:hypothetical protein [Cellvibrio fibrivorans]|uniref:DUF3077 domain-containing protein n=1 Tax=Cellvibrio fibrivorans TaxID=126350 RepID=A0ABU1V3Q5_9GAMM|nr:hypothetical protein [Cellvibrio fibrivorans]MDR7092103.1 hypothetical protein [Cellvibrio fibrivorans]
MSKATTKNYIDTPEGFMSIPKDQLFPIDAINCAKSRANAALTMLIVALNTKDASESIHPHTIAEFLWSLQGHIDQMEIMINHAYKSVHPLIHTKN